MCPAETGCFELVFRHRHGKSKSQQSIVAGDDEVSFVEDQSVIALPLIYLPKCGGYSKLQREEPETENHGGQGDSTKCCDTTKSDSTCHDGIIMHCLHLVLPQPQLSAT